MSPVARLPETAVEVLESLYQHRLLDTSEVRAMHAPGASSRWTQRLLGDLARYQLVSSAQGRGALKVWYLTRAGIEAVETTPTRAEQRRKAITPAQAAGQLQQHTLAVNHVGVSYLQAARQRGHEFGPLSWRHEIAHQVGPRAGQRRGAEVLIADALITYLITDEQTVRVEQRFLELDRGTMPIDALVAKLERYQRLHDHTTQPATGGEPVSAWRTYYRTFPEVQIVLAHKPRTALERRLRLLLALYHSQPGLREQRGVRVSVCLLEDLLADGPFAAIWLRLDDPSRHVDWLSGPARRPA